MNGQRRPYDEPFLSYYFWAKWGIFGVFLAKRFLVSLITCQIRELHIIIDQKKLVPLIPSNADATHTEPLGYYIAMFDIT